MEHILTKINGQVYLVRRCNGVEDYAYWSRRYRVFYPDYKFYTELWDIKTQLKNLYIPTFEDYLKGVNND